MMIKRIAILAAAFVMLIAAGRENDDRELQTNDSRAIEGRSAGSERSERADREYPARSDRSTGSTGYDEDAARSASERVLQRITPVEVTYDISGISEQVPEGSDPEGDDSDAATAYTEPEPEEGGADPAVEEYDWEVVDDGQYAFDGDFMHERYDVAPDGGALAEDSGTDSGSEPAEEGTEQADGGSDLEYTGSEPDTAVDSYEAEEVEEPVPEAPQMEYLGDFTISGYCGCSTCCGSWAGGPCADGSYPVEGYTCAMGGMDFGTVLYIDGVGERTVCDRGTDYGWVDLYFDSHDSALAWGLQTRAVYIVR